MTRTRRDVTALAVLTAAALLGNVLHLPLLFGVDFLFGSVAVLVAARACGPLRALFVALVAGGYTWHLWGHPYGVAIFGAEALWVGVVARRTRWRLVTVDAVFWLALGMPLVALAYGGQLDEPASSSAFAAVKQATNGVLNALLAALAMQLRSVRALLSAPTSPGPPSMNDVLFAVVTAAIVLPACVFMVVQGALIKDRHEEEALDRLAREAEALGRSLGEWHATHLQAVVALAERAAGFDLARPDTGLQAHVDTVRRALPDFAGVYVARADATAVAFSPARDARGAPTVGTRFADRPYVARLRETLRPDTSDVFAARWGDVAPTVTLSAPVLVDGRFAGYALGALDLRRLARRLEADARSPAVTVTILDAADRVVASTDAARAPLAAYDWRGGEMTPVRDGTWQRFPAESLPAAARWARSSYVRALPMGGGVPLTVLVEHGAAPLQTRLFGLYGYHLGRMLVLVLLALAVARVVSRRVVRPVEALADASADLPARLLDAAPVAWPKGSTREVEALARHFASMTVALRENFEGMRERGDRLDRLNAELTRQMQERRRVETEFRQMQKMELVGSFAGGIAHDFNNLLAVILTYLEVMATELPADSRLREDVGEVKKAALRGRDLVRQIVTFSRRERPRRTRVRPAEVVEETLGFLRATLPANVRLVASVDRGTGGVLAVPSQLQQVVLNLCANAAHALRDRGGTLEVRLDEVDVDEASARALALPAAGRHVRVAVVDDGPGIAPAVLPRIFEPFFTTKRVGEGAGMGLAMAQGIVAGHQGAITVHSIAGEGARFEVYLPRDDGAATPMDETPPAGAGARAADARVLFVDDEPLIVNLGAKMLTRLGYRVEGFTDPSAALARFAEDPAAFDVVVTDQTMPGMTGDALVQALRRLRPDVPVVLCTGFSHALTPERVAGLDVDAFLGKPMSAGELDAALRGALQARRAAA